MKSAVAGALVAGVVALDLASKSWALSTLGDGRRIDLFGGLVPLTLAFNRGAAFGLRIGPDPRWIFIPVTILAIVFLVMLIRDARPGEQLRVTSAALVLGGAVGNLYDRVRWDRGVVDFIGPVDLGFMLWPIFNVADSAITTGALLLAVSFWMEDAAEKGKGTPNHVDGPSREPPVEDRRVDPPGSEGGESAGGRPGTSQPG